MNEKQIKVIPVKVLETQIDVNNKFRKSSRRSIKNRKRNIEIETEDNTNQNNEEKCGFKHQNFIIISLIILLGFIIIFLLLFFLLIKRKKPEIEKEIEYISISLSNMTFFEAKSLMNSDKIEKNYILLNKTIEKMNNLLSFCENSSLDTNEINPDISFIFPNFLKNPTKSALKIAKSDVELYKRKYEELIKEINNFTKKIYESLKNISFPLNHIKNEISQLLDEYKETIINISIPLLLKREKLHIANTYNKNDNNLRKLLIIDEIENYQKEADNLNELYNNLFQYYNDETQNLENEINEFPSIVMDIHNRIDNDISRYRQIVDRFTDPNDIQQIHENLIDAKSSFISTKNYLIEEENNIVNRFNNFEAGYRARKLDSDKLEKQRVETISNLTSISNSIKNDVININKNTKIIDIPDLNISSLMVADHIIQSLDRTVRAIKEEEIRTSQCVENFVSIINIVEKTSLDLLFVMDITGSMKNFLEDAKKNVINIINQIILECPGIDINLGFIGYRDVPEIERKEYVDIEFTKEYEQLKNSIKDVIAAGGVGDGPEDVAWAMEQAVNKNWQNNARFLIFIADYPCHGAKYHNIPTDLYPNGVAGRRNIEELINELAQNNISLFCLEITQYTDIMYNIFSNIYQNYNKCEFKRVKMSTGESLTNIVVDSAAEIYISQRNVDV